MFCDWWFYGVYELYLVGLLLVFFCLDWRDLRCNRRCLLLGLLALMVVFVLVGFGLTLLLFVFSFC